MLELREIAPATAVPVDMLQAATAQFAGWEKLPDRKDRKEILDRGIVEEAPECVAEMQTGNVANVAEELADMQWYISERARLAGYSMSVICGPEAQTIDDFQRQAVKEPAISPIWISGEEVLDPTDHPDVTLSVLALRVADAKTMTEERLWRGYPKGIPVHRLLRDLYSHVAIIADGYDLSLSYLLDRNIEKLSSRQRPSHVLEDHQTAPADQFAKVHRQREAIGGVIQHLFVIDDYMSEQQIAA